jgi:ParB/RepB/Spo0J family partition protein
MSSTVSSHAVSPQEAVTSELVWLDPKALVTNPANVREDLRNLDELAESIAESGIVEPLVVVPLDGGYRILAGHRRAAAAVIGELDVVPCWVRADLVEAESDQVAVALIENVQRDDLTPLEEAHAYAQLSAFPNWSPGRIAQATGRDELFVRRGIEATQLSEELQPAAISGQLSLQEAARLESFADDPDTYASLVKIAGSGGIRHALVRAERERDVARRAAEVRAELETEGVRIVERPRHQDVALRVSVLTDEDGDDLDADEHAASCEGHAVYIDDYDGEAIPVCVDPARFGHVTPRWYRHETEEEAAARIAAEEAAQARRAALEDAATLRQSFIRQLIASKDKPPAGTLRLVVEMLVDDQTGLPAPEDLAWYLGYDDASELDAAAVLAEAVRKAPERRLPRMALAVVAVGAEDNVRSFGNRWGSGALALRWLSYLAGAGHQLTEAEQQLMEEARKELDAPTADTDDDG